VDVKILDLLGDLALAAGEAHTRRAVVRRLAEVLSEHVPVRRVELALAGDTVEVVEAASSRGRLAVTERTEEGPLPELPAPHLEKRAGSVTLALPVAEGDEPAARVTIVLGSATLADDALLAIGKVVAASVRHCRLVERIATLSRRAHVESAELRSRLEAATADEIIARSDVMLRVLARADLVAAHDTTVLLLGESGTGKELVARRLHARSRRAAGPFLQVNCGAIPETLVESELFGHEKGAFTGAAARHLGTFERASGGTLLLDEIGELPRAAQVKLLRVLQEGRLERVGGEKPVRVDVRVIAATHRPLESMVKRGAFRADLFYRLNVFPIELPPLRERREDIPPLVHHLLATLAARLGRPVPNVPPEALEALTQHDWPGNVRELANVLERALILSGEGELVLDAPAEAKPVPRARTRARTLEDATREHIEKALAACQGRIYGKDGAAAALGLKPSTLQSKMLRYEIDRLRFTTRSS
jgi:transcriptional regulator with GAF, ATPase, and Fis domain